MKTITPVSLVGRYQLMQALYKYRQYLSNSDELKEARNYAP